jgi:anti-sigma regulatory factor (Ser/Thr protein kinase)
VRYLDHVARRWMPRASDGEDLVARARAWIRDVVRSWSVEAVDPETVALVVSELLTNALLHASKPVDIAIDVEPGRMRVEVWDSSPRAVARPRGGPLDPDDVGGWGLEIVDRLSDGWGVEQSNSRKCVWAEFGRNPL